MKKANVLHLVEYLYLGGIERVLEQLALASRDKVNLHFFTYETSTLDGIGKAIKEQKFPVFTYKKRPGRDWALWTKLVETVRQYNIDVVHTHDFGPIEYAWLLKMRYPWLRLIHTQHTMHHFVIKPRYRYFFQWASYFYEKVVCVSDFVRTSIEESCPLTKQKNLTVIYNGVDTTRFRPQGSSIGPQDSLRLVSIARISYEKNLEYLLNTCRLLKEAGVPFVLNHAGTSKWAEAREKLEQYIQDHQLQNHVTLHGYKNDATEILALGDYFLSTSKREGHPVALLEAMAAEKFCICSDITPHRETAHGLVELYKLEDEKALFRVLRNIYLTKPNLSESKKKLRNLVIDNYSLERMAGRYVELYK